MKLNLKSNKLRARFYAFGIDLFAIALIQKALIISYFGFINSYLFSFSHHAQSFMRNNISSVELPIMILSFWSYFFLSIYTTRGKTLGHTIMGLEIYSPSDDEPPCIWQSITRATISTLSYLMILPLSFPLFNKKRRSLADVISQTVVLQLHENKGMYKTSPVPQEAKPSDQRNSA